MTKRRKEFRCKSNKVKFEFTKKGIKREKRVEYLEIWN